MQQLRMAAAWAGPVRLDCYLAGDGDTSCTVRLAGQSGVVDLTVGGGAGGVRKVEIALAGEHDG